jgi:acyl-CoA reductase-like NAD-dependent aldehyde dehydrogenase
VDEEQMTKSLHLVDSGRKQGAKLLAGGSRHGDRGYFVQPTVFADVKDDMTIAKEEARNTRRVNSIKLFSHICMKV